MAVQISTQDLVPTAPNATALRALTVQGEALIVPNAANGTSAYLDVSDATGSNGGSYSLNIRGLDNDGIAGVNLASINLLANNVGVGTGTPIRTLTVQGEASIVPNAANGTSAYLDISDATGSNGGSYSLNIRGLDNDGTAGVNLASINLLADNFLFAGNAGPRLSVDSNGNVTIHGNLNVDGTITYGKLVQGNTQ